MLVPLQITAVPEGLSSRAAKGGCVEAFQHRKGEAFLRRCGGLGAEEFVNAGLFHCKKCVFTLSIQWLENRNLVLVVAIKQRRNKKRKGKRSWESSDTFCFSSESHLSTTVKDLSCHLEDSAAWDDSLQVSSGWVKFPFWLSLAPCVCAGECGCGWCWRGAMRTVSPLDTQ